MTRFRTVLSITLLVALLAACGQDSAPLLVAPPPAGPAAAFTLRELAGNEQTGTARLRLEQLPLRDGGMLLRVHADEAQALKGAFYELRYDPAHYSPRSAQALTGLGPTDELLTLCDMQTPGTVQQGMVLRQAGDKPGLSGSAPLAELRFDNKPCVPLRTASAAPRSQRSRAALSLDESSLALRWGYASEGDYDQNSEVNVADLAPLGFNFLQTTNGNGPFPAGSKFFMIDGDQNGELNIADLSPIGTNFQRMNASYNVYQSASAADIPSSDSAPSTLAPLGFVNLADADAPADGGQKRFVFTLPEIREGWFYWVRPVDGVGAEGILSNVVTAGVNPDNTAPIASFTATPQSGDAPLEVSFDASASSDSDGSITEFAWDFDGNGSVDAASASPTEVFTYQSIGVFQARLTVTDDGGATDSTIREISVGAISDNIPPIASFTATPQSGNAPLEVSFDASASSDSDGSIAEFSWDFDGDGVIDASSSNAVVEFTYQAIGNFEARLTVTDNRGATDNSSLTISVTADPNNVPPVASFTASPLSGELPLNVSFDAVASSDSDGTIVEFSWDFDGDGTVDATSASPNEGFLYLVPGEFEATLTVTDDGGATDSISATISVDNVPVPQPPVAILEVTSPSGDAPQTVTLDASASTDADGSIVSFEWDFDGDGSFDAITSEPQAEHEYTVAGDFNPVVRVTDNDALTNTDSATLRIRGFVRSEFGIGPDADHAAGITVAVINGNPALCWIERESLAGDVRYVRSLTAVGQGQSEWPAPISVPQLFAQFTPRLLEVAGNPAIVAGESESRYIRSTTSSGMNPADWPASIELNSGASIQFVMSAAVVDGRPAFVVGSAVGLFNDTHFLAYLISDTPTGANLADWPPPVFIETVNTTGGFGPNVHRDASLQVLNGRPAVAYTRRGQGGDVNMRLRFSSTADGSSASDWSSFIDLDTSGSRIDNPLLLVIGGRPTIINVDSANKVLLYRRSSTASGGSLADWSVFSIGSGDPGLPNRVFFGAAVAENRPFAVFSEPFASSPTVVTSTTPTGESLFDWLNPLRFPGGTVDVNTTQILESEPRIAALEAGGQTAFAFIDNSARKVVYVVMF